VKTLKKIKHNEDDKTKHVPRVKGPSKHEEQKTKKKKEKKRKKQ
jgi:hypothetical protein